MTRIREWFEKWFNNEMTSGLLMIAAMFASILCANSPWREPIENFWNTRLFVGIADVKFSRPLDWWINDVLMVFFFLQIGFELKKEIKEGFLSDPKQILVPALAALGGIICPAIIYAIINHGEPQYMNGWAIPTATDIAFAICVLMLVGKAVPQAVKIFLLAIAIFDDLGAIIIIALFYNQGVSIDLLGYAGVACILLYMVNKMQITSFVPYLVLGVALWYCFLNGGVHTTIAGVVVAMAYPMRVTMKKYSPLACPMSQATGTAFCRAVQASSYKSGMPSSRASPLPEPLGTMPRAVCVPTNALAVSLMVPSPPATMTRSYPSLTACAASSVAWPACLVNAPCASGKLISAARSKAAFSMCRAPLTGLIIIKVFIIF